MCLSFYIFVLHVSHKKGVAWRAVAEVFGKSSILGEYRVLKRVGKQHTSH